MLFYDDLIQNQYAEFNWPQFGQETPSSLCYTSGTTGIRKAYIAPSLPITHHGNQLARLINLLGK